jgi:hypothetical protein
MIMSLEPRMLFDGAVAATVAEAAQPDSQPTVDAGKTSDQTDAGHGQADLSTVPVAIPGSTVVFVDSRVKDADSLLADIAPGAQVVKLDASKDGLQQIADYLESHQGVSSVQIIAHGNSGDLWLGNSYLSADNIAQRSALLAEIGQDMNAGGDILIYACNTAAGEKGLNFVDSLAQLTGRDVAASTNRTGGGGDWELEISTGTIESVSALSAQSMASYDWGLATLTVTSTASSGAGTLREALSNAQDGDIVTFNSGMRVLLTSQLEVTKNIVLDGDIDNDGIADVTLDGQYKTSVIKVDAGTTVTFEGLVITRGLIAGNGADGGFSATDSMGGGISNAGDLTLNNVTVTANVASGGGGGGGVTSTKNGGGGGGGAGFGGQNGGTGGHAGHYNTTSPGPNRGGNGASFRGDYFAGYGGTATGGKGGNGDNPGHQFGYSTGGNGGTASNGTISIGGGGGGAGLNAVGGSGGNAAGGIYNASSGTLTIIGTSSISNNLGAGGGGGGGGGKTFRGDSNGSDGGAGGRGVGAIWNKGTLQITAENMLLMTGNAGGSGSGGLEENAGVSGATPASYNTIFNDGGTLNTNYNDMTLPTVVSIVVANPTLKVDDTTTVTITFSEPVIQFSESDLAVSNGSLSGLSSSDGIIWTATFTPTANITDTTNVITLNSAGITDLSGNAGVGSTDSNNYAIDTEPPVATIVLADTALKAGETSQVTITFSEPVIGFDNADLTVPNGTLSAVGSSDGGITWTATFTPDSDVTDTSNLITLDKAGVTDLAGNSGVGYTDSANFTIDTQRPTATIVVADNTLLAGATSLVTITFTEPVSGLTTADLTVENGTLSHPVSSDGGITWTAILTPNGNVSDGANLITLDNTGVSDAAANNGSGTTDSNPYAMDTVRPTATIVMSDSALVAGKTALVTITFSEAVSGFTNADLTVENGILSNVSSADGGITWTATFTPRSGVYDTSNLISLSNAGVTNQTGNAGSGTTVSANYIVGIKPVSTGAGDPQFRLGEPAPLITSANLLQPPSMSPPPVGSAGLVLGFPALFEQRTPGGNLPPTGSIFIHNGALAPSFIAQVFKEESVGEALNAGFLGLDGGDGSVLGRSTLSTLFSHEHLAEVPMPRVFDGWSHDGSGDSSSAVTDPRGSLSLERQLQQLSTQEHTRLQTLAWALGSVEGPDLQV